MNLARKAKVELRRAAGGRRMPRGVRRPSTGEQRVIGQRTRVYEVLQGRRSLSLNMIRELYDEFGIPANVLIQPGRQSRKRAGRRASYRARTNRVKRSL